MNKAFRIGEWRIYPLRNEIEGEGRQTRLEPRVMQVLVELAGNAGEVCLRSDLLERVWGTRAEVSDECLTRAISLLRQALGDSPRQARFIRTVHKRGYRLMQPAEVLAPVRRRARQPLLHSLHRSIRAFVIGLRRRYA